MMSVVDSNRYMVALSSSGCTRVPLSAAAPTWSTVDAHNCKTNSKSRKG